MLSMSIHPTLGSSVNTSADSNIYEFNAARALETFAAYAEGTPNATLVVVSERALGTEARNALASSAERLGFGRAGILWVVCEPEVANAPLSTAGLQELLVACDPLAFTATDARAATLLGDAFGVTCSLDSAGRLEGRNAVAFTDFEGMLSAPEDKQRAWALLKRLA